MIPIAAGFFRWNATAQTSRMVKLLPAAALVPFDKIHDVFRHVAQLQVAAPAQFLGDVGRNIARPTLVRVEAEYADRV